MTTNTDYFYSAPNDTVIVAAADGEYRYSFVVNRDGDDLFGLVLEDAVAGPLCVALSAEQACDVAENLLIMVRDRAALRAQFKENPNE